MVVHVVGQPRSNTFIPDKVLELLNKLEAHHATVCGIKYAEKDAEVFIHPEHDRLPDKNEKKDSKKDQETFGFYKR